MSPQGNSKPLGAVILHLTPLPGSWPATPERRLARLLKYALRITGYRATRIEPVAQEGAHLVPATTSSADRQRGQLSSPFTLDD